MRFGRNLSTEAVIDSLFLSKYHVRVKPSSITDEYHARIGLHIKSTRPLSSITEMTTSSTAIEKNVNENLPKKENEISFDEFSQQNPLLIFGISLFCAMAILKVFIRLKIYVAEIPAIDSLFMKTFGEKWETFKNEGLVINDVYLTANSVLGFISSSFLAMPFFFLIGTFLQRYNVGTREATIYLFALSLLITYQNYYEISMDPKYSNLIEVFKLQFEKEIHHQIETARARNLTDEKIQEIILTDANLQKSSLFGEDEAYLLKMLQGEVVITPETVGTITPEPTGTITPLTPKTFVGEKPL